MIRVPRKESQTIHPTQQLSGWALSSVMSNCAEKDAIAKSQDVSRAWSDAASLVQSIIKKIEASPQ